MTLISYPPRDLDGLALRMFDLAAEVRRLAQRSREAELDAVLLHGNKIQEWLTRLESWTHDAKSRTDAEINRQQAARRAQEFLTQKATKKPRRKK